MPTIIEELRGSGGEYSYQNGLIVYTEEKIFLVQAESAQTTKYSVLTTPGIPTVFATTINAGGGIKATCRSKKAKRADANGTVWEVSCNFSSEPIGENQQGGGERPGDPETWIPLVSVSFESYEEASVTDAVGNAVVNSAGDEFAGGIMLTRSLCVFSITQYEDGGQTLDDIVKRNEKINNAGWQLFPARTCKCCVSTADLSLVNGTRVWKITYQIKYKPSSWDLKVLDVGPNQKVGGQIKACVDKQGNPTMGSLLNGVQVTDGSGPGILSFKIYSTINFNFLRI